MREGSDEASVRLACAARICMWGRIYCFEHFGTFAVLYSSLQRTIRTCSTVSIDGHKAEPWTVVLDSHRNQSGILSVPVDTYCSHSVSVCQKQILVRNVCNQFTMKFIPDFQLELVNRSEICQIKYRTFKNVAHVYTFYSK